MRISEFSVKSVSQKENNTNQHRELNNAFDIQLHTSTV